MRRGIGAVQQRLLGQLREGPWPGRWGGRSARVLQSIKALEKRGLVKKIDSEGYGVWAITDQGREVAQIYLGDPE